MVRADAESCGQSIKRLMRTGLSSPVLFQCPIDTISPIRHIWGMPMLRVWLDEGPHREFKVWCAVHGRKMSQEVQILIHGLLRNQEVVKIVPELAKDETKGKGLA